ncbi:MAG TPA: hypothetical protein VFT39_18945 [Vicinamibacterales bacterium]|nr:hypothetical protein [Vicinamibacterales bacterium]
MRNLCRGECPVSKPQHQVLGHDESIYKMPAMLAHILTGTQYV